MAISDDLNSIRTHLEDDYTALEQLGVSVEDRNIENIKDMANQIYAKFPKTSYAEGSNITLSNTLKGKLDFEDGIVGIGDTSQKSYQGYNLCEAKMPTTTATQGITFTNNGDGTYTVSGTNSSEAAVTFRINQSTQIGGDNLQNYEDGTYTLDLGIANANMQLTLMQNVSWTSYIATGYGIRLRSQAITNVTNTFIYVGVKGNASFDTPVTIKPMLVKGSYTESTMPSFEPYVGETASPNSSYSQEVKVVRGKNLLNLDWFENNHSLGSDGLPNAFNGRVANTTPIDVTYYNSMTLSYKNNSIMFIYSLFDKNNSFLKRVASNTSGTTINTINASKLYISFYDSVSISKENINDPQIEQGSTATSYLPFNTIEVKARGKNKLNFSEWLNTLMDKNPNITAGSIDSHTDNSITITANGEDCFTASYTISNNAATNKTFCETYPSLVQEVKENTKYTFSFERSNTSIISRPAFFFLDKDYNYLGLDDQDRTAVSSVTLTTPSNAKYMTFRVGIYHSNGSTLTISNLMLEESPSATSYEPYYTPQIKQLSLGNFKPFKIGNYKDYFYRTSGKNKFIEYETGYISNLDGSITANGSVSVTDYIPIPSGASKVYFYGKNLGVSSGNQYANRLAFYDSNKTWVQTGQKSNIGTPTECDIPSGASYLRASIVTAVDDKMISFGGVTDYQPYGSGEWYFKGKNGYTQITNSTSIVYDTSLTNVSRFRTTITNVINATQNGSAYCNVLINKDGFSIDEEHFYIFGAAENKTMYFFIPNSIASNLSQLQTWLTTHLMEVYYTLLNATDTKITDTTMISQLEEIYNLMSYTGTTIIEIDGQLPLIIKVRALKGN